MSKLSDHQLKFFADFIQKELGIQFSEANYYHLDHRLQDIAKQCGFTFPDGLWTESQKGISGFFRQLLLDVATNNESSFFRDADLFKAITEVMIPSLKQKHPNLNSVNIWSAASSTGQEVYSLMMAIEEQRKKDISFPNYKIRATDISDRVLKYANAAVYTQLEVQRGLPTKLMLEYFEPSEANHWRVSERFKKNIIFSKQNLLDPFVFAENFDIVLIRNVLIYQGIENRKNIINKIFNLLPSGGYMAMGAAESLLGISDQFKSNTYNNIVFYQKP